MVHLDPATNERDERSEFGVIRRNLLVRPAGKQAADAFGELFPTIASVQEGEPSRADEGCNPLSRKSGERRSPD
jgi:hypothetical protein